MSKDFLNDPFYNYSKEELINKIAELRDVFDFPEETSDIDDPMYYNLGAICGCPIEALASMIKITKERNK